MSSANKRRTPFPEALERWFSTTTNVSWKSGWINTRISSMRSCQVSLVFDWRKRSTCSIGFRTEECRCRRRFRTSRSSWTSKMQRFSLVSPKRLSRKFDARRFSSRRSGESVDVCYFSTSPSISWKTTDTVVRIRSGSTARMASIKMPASFPVTIKEAIRYEERSLLLLGDLWTFA